MTQQAMKIEPSLLKRIRSRHEPRHQAQLGLNLLDELLDGGGRGGGLLALHGDQRVLALEVGVVHLDDRIDRQSTADQCHDQCRVLAEKTATPSMRIGGFGAACTRHYVPCLRAGIAGALPEQATTPEYFSPQRARDGRGSGGQYLQAGSQSPHATTPRTDVVNACRPITSASRLGKKLSVAVPLNDGDIDISRLVTNFGSRS